MTDKKRMNVDDLVEYAKANFPQSLLTGIYITDGEFDLG